MIQLEEQHLRRLFPEYQEYAEAVPAIWPRVGQASRPVLGRTGKPAAFRWDLYLRNQEYNAPLPDSPPDSSCCCGR